MPALDPYASPWDTAARDRKARTVLAGCHEPLPGPSMPFDVIVVGAGVVGATTALLLARAGARVAVVDARDRLDGTTTLHATVKVTTGQGLVLNRLARRRGREHAVRYAAAHRAGHEVIAGLADEIEDCQPTRGVHYVYAASPSLLGQLETEANLLSEAGLPRPRIDTVPAPLEAAVALAHEDLLLLHPGHYLVGLLGLLLAAGGSVHLGCRVQGLEDGARVRVSSTRGSAVADRVVVTTHGPIEDRAFLTSRLTVRPHHGIALRLPADIACSSYPIGAPTRSTRPLQSDGRPGLIVVGEDPYEALAAWARTTFQARKVTHRWTAQSLVSLDGTPYVGSLRPRSDRLLAATGFAAWGFTGGSAAALDLVARLGGTTTEWTASWDASRVGGPRTWAAFVLRQATVAKDLVSGLVHADPAGGLPAEAPVRRPASSDPASSDPASAPPRTPGAVAGPLPRGCVRGRLVGQVAEAVDEQGVVHRVSARCTHMGCTVAWSEADGTWLCPCHGSRFALDGSVLTGPGTRPLRPIPADVTEDVTEGAQDERHAG